MVEGTLGAEAQSEIPIEERFAAALTAVGDDGKPKADPKPEEKPAAPAAAGADDAEIKSLMDEIDALQHELAEPAAAAEEPAAPEAKPKSKEDLLARLAESNDPGTKALVEEVLALREKVSQREQAETQQAGSMAEDALRVEQKECIQKYRLTREEFNHSMNEWGRAVQSDPSFASLRYEEVLFRIYGVDALVQRTRPAAGPAGGAPAGGPRPAAGPEPARIVTDAAAGSGLPRGAKTGPVAGESFEQVKNRVLREQFGITPDA